MAKFKTVVLLVFLLLLANISKADNFTSSTLWNGVYDIKVIDNYAYCAYYGGLVILDISDPTMPSLVGNEIIPGFTCDIDIDGHFAYLADKENGLRIVNIMDPQHPFLMSTHQTPGRATDVFISEGYAYVADFDSGFCVFDVSDPSDVSLVGRLRNQMVLNIHVDGDWAYAAMYYSMGVLDVSNPDQPYRGISISVGSLVRDLFVSGDHVYVATDSGMAVVAIPEGEMPRVVGSWQGGNRSTGIVVSGDYAYIGTDFYGLNIVDISDPEHPVWIGSYEVSIGWPRVSFGNDIAWVAGASSDIYAIDVAEPSNPALSGVYPASYDVVDVVASGNYACAVDGNYGPWIIDISDPFAPEIVSGWEKDNDIRDICMTDGYCYLVDDSSRFEILDMTDPSNPVLSATLDLPGSTHSVSVRGGYAFVAAGDSGLVIIDIADPENPEINNSFHTEYDALEAILSGDYAYVKMRLGGILLVDISTPTAPVYAGVFQYYSASADFAAIDNYLLIAHQYRLTIYRRNDSGEFPVFELMSESPLSHSADNIAVMGNYAFIGEPGGGWYDNTSVISIFDFSDPVYPDFMGAITIPYYSPQLYANDGQLYVANTFSLLMLRMFDPTDIADGISNAHNQPSLALNYPNPFNATTTIRYDLPIKSDVRLEIYDILGRKVKTPVNGWQAAGFHSADWDAVDKPSGVYYYRLTTNGIHRSRKCVHLK